MLFPQDTIPQKNDNSSYLVFARKYRPQNFQELIGQSHLVEILTNAFEHNRIAHAYILTGVRGVGKTTTARIIAKGLNCLSVDKPTINPCGICSNCISITEGKNIDVFEMDAASRTGIDDIREIIDAIPYKPLNCRYKVYIIDEIHMLSKQAFNGLLKTLEEPPSHVKFIFATTELHKILPTILSRCQKIDLKRVNVQALVDFFSKILTAENVTFDISALATIARSSDGSVRDGLSLLDQAVAASPNHINMKIVTDMVGSVQGSDIIDIIQECLNYQPKQALALFYNLYNNGYDCHLFAKELLKTTEWLVRIKYNADNISDIAFDEEYILKSKKIAENSQIHLLSRIWDIALKAVQDIKIAPDPKAVCEMALIRINYGLALPDPEMMFQNIKTDTEKKNLTNQPEISYLNAKDSISSEEFETITSLDDLFGLLSKHRHLDLVSLLQVKSVIQNFKVGSFSLLPAADYKITTKDTQFLQKTLQTLTGQSWHVIIEKNEADNQQSKTFFEIKKETKATMVEAVKQDKNIQNVFNIFPNAKVTQVIDNDALPNV